MNKIILGLDLGTSAVKLLGIRDGRIVLRERLAYEEESPRGWEDAVWRILGRVRGESIAAIGLSSQVGTYILNGETVMRWSDDVGDRELGVLKECYSRECFIREIGMPHPDIRSYPLPRLMAAGVRVSELHSFMQLKDSIVQKLCGVLVSDPFSWRGLAKGGAYSPFFLRELGLSPSVLPPLIDVCARAGVLSHQAEEACGIEAGIPVYVGMNDYFCSLLGLGFLRAEDETLFDITGSSEHVGLLQKELVPESDLVSGPYLEDYVHYGVTASTGASLNFGRRLFGDIEPRAEAVLQRKPPVFLPYLNGERAPVFDGAARGVFFGLTPETDREAMAYAVMEGCVFSTYHIYEHLGSPALRRIRISGGACANALMNRLKAELFRVGLEIPEETETSALGAAMLAESGETGSGLAQTMRRYCKIKERTEPDGSLYPVLLRRYGIYRDLYPRLREAFRTFHTI